MKTAKIAALAVSGLALIGAGAYAAGHAKDVALEFPANYKTEFTEYFSGDRQNGKQHISFYANDIALQGAQADGKLPYGSVLIGEIIPAVMVDGEPVESQLGRLIHTGEVKTIVLMQRIEGNDDRYSDELKVGDWEFEVFSPAGENLGKDTTACRECHHPLTDTEYLWSYEHLTQAAVE